MSKEAMKLALEALEKMARWTGPLWALENNYAGHLEAITALREALAAQQEPLGYIATMALNDLQASIYRDVAVYGEETEDVVAIYTTPQAQPAREPTKAMIDAAERIDWSDSDVRGNIVNMWQAMCAVAPQAPAVPVRQELWGWAILHSDGTDAHVRSRITDFFGQIKEREPFSDDRLKQCDLYWAGLAPHRIVELYIRDNTPQAPKENT